MPQEKTSTETNRRNQIIEDVKRYRESRADTYRERALKMFPWVCAKCGREFSGKRLRELTVHHRDHNHDNNPPDGSNWELLCLYCHDNEHSRHLDAQGNGESGSEDNEKSSLTHQPFAGLDALLKKKK